LSGELVPLEGERDQNLRLTRANGDAFVVKISNAMEAAEVVDFQHKALIHIQQSAPHLPVPRPLPTLKGHPWCAIGEKSNHFRVLSYVEGLPVTVARFGSTRLAQSAGEFMGKISSLMLNFNHPNAEYFMAWDLNNKLLANDELWDCAADDLRSLESALRPRICAQTLPSLASLRRQVVHHDAHQHNLLVDSPESETIAGLIDFGDIINTAVVSDLAIVSLGFAEDRPNPEISVAHVVTGYHDQYPLLKQEIDLLFEVMLAREVLTVLLFDFRIAHNASASEYVCDSRPELMKALQNLMSIGGESFRDAIFDHCKL
jgi:hydroxylysine kinase